MLIRPTLRIHRLSLRFILKDSSRACFVNCGSRNYILYHRTIRFHLNDNGYPINVELRIRRRVNAPRNSTICRSSPPLRPITTRFFLLFSIYPFQSPTFLVLSCPLTRFFIPSTYHNGVGKDKERLRYRLFHVNTFTKAYSSNSRCSSFR